MRFIAQPKPILFVGRPVLLRFAPTQGKPVPQLAGTDSRHRPRGVALTWSMRPLSDNGRRHDSGEQRLNPRSHDHHHCPAANAQDRCSFLDPGQRPARIELQQHMQQGDQTLAVGMQKAEVARPPETFGQHVLEDQPQKLRTGHGAPVHLPGLGVAITESDLAVSAGEDVFLGDDAAVTKSLEDEVQEDMAALDAR